MQYSAEKHGTVGSLMCIRILSSASIFVPPARMHNHGKTVTSYVNVYSGNSHNGPSEKRTPTLQWTLAVLRIETTIAVIY